MKLRLALSLVGVVVLTAVFCWTAWYAIDGLREAASVRAQPPSGSRGACHGEPAKRCVQLHAASATGR